MRLQASCTLAAVVVLLASCGGGSGLPWQEDFAAPGAWQTETDAAAQVAIQDGFLRVYVAIPNQLAWGSAGRDLRDLHLTVEASQVAGPDDNEYGVLVRLQDPGNFYAFSISGDGYYRVSKFVDGEHQVLGSNWTPSEAIRQGAATNVVEVICQGSRLALVVNGQELARVDDDQFARGDVGLYAGSFYEGEVEIHFDNLGVTEP
jgi:hypothetical protein